MTGKRTMIYDGGKWWYLPTDKIVYENGKVRTNDTLQDEDTPATIEERKEETHEQ